MLTRKQHDLLLFIDKTVKENGVAPSFEEMMHAIGLKSKSGVDRLVKALVERGFLKRIKNRARAIEVCRLPNDQTDTIKTKTAGMLSGFAESLTIPLYGKIAAGTPISAITDVSWHISPPADMISRGRDYYALLIDGDSMVEAGINDGDTVVIERTETANNGDIVVALIDQEEATLKRFAKRSNNIVELHPENRHHAVQTYSADRVRIQGKLAGLIRQY